MPDFTYVPKRQFSRLLATEAPAAEKTPVFADLCRINTLYMVARAGSGHIGSSFSSLDLVSWLFLNEIRKADSGAGFPFRDLYFSSKGHDAPGLYAVLIALGVIDFDRIHRLRRLGGLPGHPDVSTPGIVTNTGSLGMGISKAKGMVLAHRLQGEERRVFVMTGDGELQEGQLWESLASAVNRRMHELTVIVDHNKIQSDIWVSKTSDLGDLRAKFEAFGWHVLRCNGHDPARLAEALAATREPGDRPHMILADTVKGAGVSFMLHRAGEDETLLYPYHSGAPSPADYAAALDELVTRTEKGLRGLGLGPIELEKEAAEGPAAPASRAQRLVDAYSQALLEQAEKRPEVVALDADLKLDCGLIPFEERFPDRFVECGIAEQDMVSTAGGMALEGLRPVVHSFSCFLSSRPNEQIYNNASEGGKITYVGFLAGLLPGGPGHSHQSVRDISALGAVPGLVMIQPCCEMEVALALAWSLNEAEGSSYLRIVQIPCEISFTLPPAYELKPGRGVVVREGADAALIAYGPVMLEQAFQAAVQAGSEGLSVRVINLPWLNIVDPVWLGDAAAGCRAVFTLDDQYVKGGQGEMIGAALAEAGLHLPVHRMGLTTFPACGTNEEVLRHHGLDAGSIRRRLLATA